ncbi:MAG: P1 family peptidase [Actinomycetota bacterium]
MITQVRGIRLGHFTHLRALTGCTVILPPPATVGSVFIPGNAPATRETDAIQPGRRVLHVDAVLLTGGSAFGLGAANGVMRWLEERGIGHPAPAGPVPIVPTAAIYDLTLGDAATRPDDGDAYAACDDASETNELQGNVGAGTGATVGKTAGFENMSKGGLGQDSAWSGALVVGALAVVNSVGDVVEEDGSVIAGARAEPLPMPTDAARDHTTIACVATNARLGKEGARAVAEMASTGIARATRPSFTMWDGDTVFALATGAVDADAERVGALAADVLARAIRNAARAASDAGGVPARGRRAGLPQGDVR